MNFLELIIHLDTNKEPVLSYKTMEIITDCNRYIKVDGIWSLDTHPGKPVSQVGRGGLFWTWKTHTEEELVVKDAFIPLSLPAEKEPQRNAPPAAEGFNIPPLKRGRGRPRKIR